MKICMAEKKEIKTVPEPAPGPLFIVSMWRAGSSLLYALLNKHGQVALMFEADLLLLRPVFLKPARVCDWAQRWEFWNQTFSRHGLDPTEFGGVLPDFRSAFETVHKEYARRKGAAIWGDKSPNYHDQLVQMAKDFPRARFIIVWRNPVEMIGATLRAAAFGNRYFRKRGMPWRSLLGYRTFKRQCDQLISAGLPCTNCTMKTWSAIPPRSCRTSASFWTFPTTTASAPWRTLTARQFMPAGITTCSGKTPSSCNHAQM